ncbi:glycosyltransferase family 4 protein [Pontibacter kalidii]|uniref:glycosyltransferase family 4 protein n=1 Tax=Pontibacter kalidii TaxID=2592049 RepID=UPI002254F88C|nr:glycosyltransferase family 4 protein [Pontibacter kalidii]
MRIARVCTVLDFGGVEKRLVNVAESCPEGVETIFIALGKGGWASQKIELLGKQVICLEEDFKIPNVSLIVTLVKLFKKLKPDVVHTSGAEANFHAQLAAYIARIPKRISEEIGFPNHNRGYRFIFKYIYSLSDKVICISASVANKVIGLREATREKISVVYNPIKYKEFKRDNEEQRDRIRFVTVCRLDKIKNLDRFIRVFSTLVESGSNCELIIVGDGPEKGALTDLTKELYLEDNIKFVGFSNEPSSFLLNSDFFVLPSYSEGLGNAIMEAMLTGLPCIVSEVGGGVELVEEGVNGWLLNPHSESNILEKLNLALSIDAVAAKKMGERSQELLKTNFSPKVHWEKLMSLYTA